MELEIKIEQLRDIKGPDLSEILQVCFQLYCLGHFQISKQSEGSITGPSSLLHSLSYERGSP